MTFLYRLAQLILAASLLAGAVLVINAIERRAEPQVPEALQAQDAPAPTFSHPLCFQRDQWVKQSGGGAPVNECVKADLRR